MSQNCDRCYTMSRKPLYMQHYVMLSRHLLYTGLTRARATGGDCGATPCWHGSAAGQGQPAVQVAGGAVEPNYPTYWKSKLLSFVARFSTGINCVHNRSLRFVSHDYAARRFLPAFINATRHVVS
ncbi:hypothetical protein [Microseira sp. BLCC-F43]|uniref:hypothetical protein n=1 Tax=Microseira sp. BLCC-F43 TaxID=3153602 RepID=UPI0035BC58CB